ncbi:DMT family transporter [Polluticoccus soli]|uniref:DMT family transporter n=1 Tax=Polluticoccus soli TaxID=3034150 RepID=UPI0023E0A2F0|nr:EamA family transporter [Flavipsychrobacter sp. JY13-12]
MAKHTKAYIALVFICIVWGTTYLFIRLGVEHYPAFLFAGVRQVISALIIMALGLAMAKKVDLSWASIKHQALVGFLLITVGNGLVTWAEKYVPSGVAALICSLMPIITVMINLASAKGERPNPSILLGTLVGFSGVALIFRDNIADLANTQYLLGMLGLLCATSSWSLGSVINKRHQFPTNPVFNSGLQLMFGGIFLLIASPAFDSYENVFTWHAGAFWSLLYLIIFGSVAAYTAYMYALKELPVGLVATYAYVNPLVAVILGYLILDEQLTWYTALSFAAIMTGVYMVNRGYIRKHLAARREKERAKEVLPTPVTTGSK